MKKIKNYILGLPKAVKWIFAINVLVYILCLIIFEVFDVKLQNYLGLFPTYSENFNPLQLVTNLFTHLMDFSHIFFNMLYFLIFAPFVEKKLGTKLFIVTYFVCGFFGNVFITYNYYKIKPIIESSIESVGVDIKDIKVSNFLVDDEYISTLNETQIDAVKEYNNVISKTYGASPSVFGIVLIYLLFNILNIKKIIFNLLSLYLIFLTIVGFVYSTTILTGSDYTHLGGLIGGLLIFIFFKTKKDIV
jgi:membrane associated rhomboid family serine protease